jgi:hypothetical protein
MAKLIQMSTSKRCKNLFPISNWKDLLYIWNMNDYGGGHGINDNLYALRPTNSNTNKGSEELFESAINNYINILTKAFGEKFNFRMKKKDLEKVIEEIMASGNNYYYNKQTFTLESIRIGQTPCFSIIEKLVERKRDKNADKN